MQSTGHSLTKKLWPLGLIAEGTVLVLGSVAYGILFVGIPGQDEAPGQLARQETQGSFVFGAFTFLVGFLVLLLDAVASITKLTLAHLIQGNHPTPYVDLIKLNNQSAS